MFACVLEWLSKFTVLLRLGVLSFYFSYTVLVYLSVRLLFRYHTAVDKHLDASNGLMYSVCVCTGVAVCLNSQSFYVWVYCLSIFQILSFYISASVFYQVLRRSGQAPGREQRPPPGHPAVRS